MADHEQEEMMVIASDFIFVHVPRTGGVSITQALGGRSAGFLHKPLRAIQRAGRRAFGVVRNPWEWRVSLYSFLCQKQTRSNDEIIQQRRCRAAGFRNWLLHESMMVGDVGVQRCSQFYWLEGCDQVLRFERLSDDFARLVRDWRIRCRPLVHVNASQHDDYHLYYDDTSRDFVADHSAYELSLGYGE